MAGCGSLIHLKRLEERHLKRSFHFRNVWTEYFRQVDDLSWQEHLQWFDNTPDMMYSIYEDKKYIGVAGLTEVNMKDRKAELSFYLFDTYIDGRCYDVLNLLTEKAFGIYNMNMVWCEIYDNDFKKYKLLEDYGFAYDGVLRDSYYLQNMYYNSHYFSMLKREWEKLSERVVN